MRLVFLGLLLASPLPVVAQQPVSHSAFRGTIASIATTRPIQTAEIRLMRIDSVKAEGEFFTDSSRSHVAVSDAAGAFNIRDVEPGKYLVIVRRVGFKPFEGMLTLGDAPVEMQLALESGVAALPAMNVTEVMSRVTKRLDGVGFTDRRKQGNTMRAYDHADVLAARAVRTEQILDKFGITRTDVIMFDGIPVEWKELIEMPSEVIVAAEIYRSMAMAPVEFTRTLPGRQTFTDAKPATDKVLVARQPLSAGSFTPPDSKDKGVPLVSHFVLIWSYIP